MKLKFIMPIILIVLLCSCSRVQANKADEIRAHKWSAQLKSKSVELSFHGDEATFTTSSNGTAPNASIKGLCVIDDRDIFISDSESEQSYRFSYTLKNNRLILRFDGGELTLLRV